MSLIPAFQIGVWNAWIFMLYNFLPMPFLMLIHRDAEPVPPSDSEKKLRPFAWIVWILAFVYSVFLPLKLGTIWFYVGLPIALVGLITFTMVIVTFAITPVDVEPLNTGLYRYSRHPMYVTQALMFIGVSIASASWLFLLFTIVYTILPIISVEAEEQSCLEKYGDAYREYMNKTPRWLGLPKSGRK
jgi:protein-S-isoprenylcysteine O-methyltransferase Ste14